jgi:hypothetical protein
MKSSSTCLIPATLCEGPIFYFYCSALPLEKGRTPVLGATHWITDSTTVQNIVIIAIVSKFTT